MKIIVLLIAVGVLSACTVVEDRGPTRTTTMTSETTLHRVPSETQVIRTY